VCDNLIAPFDDGLFRWGIEDVADDLDDPDSSCRERRNWRPRCLDRRPHAREGDAEHGPDRLRGAVEVNDWGVDAPSAR
jgi:hypothetical protein